MVNIANILSLSRLIMSPFLLFLAWSSRPELFLFFVILALATDLLDGYFARKYQLVSELGARLDSMADVAIYLTVPLSIWWLWPEIIIREAGYVATALVSFTIPVIFGFVKFRRLTSYHTRGAKLSALLLSSSTLLMLLQGPSWPFHLATAFFVLAELEEFCITALLTRWQPDIPSVLPIVRQRRRARH
ncbi:MAG: CDP-alcohol phosphatidyltransferase family protein [Deltaproteobacteria bacterium]|nr:CDP-alcohol phosphatidyltransferase family protein [Deltaproteobacteria bacterium]